MNHHTHTIFKMTVEYIETHIDEDLSLEKIAEQLHYSKFYLARIFRQETGLTVCLYIRSRRLTIAAQKLVETKKPIVEIACEAHYNSQQAFTLAFHQLYECTPQAYREKGIFYPKQIRIDNLKTPGTLKTHCTSHSIKGGVLAA